MIMTMDENNGQKEKAIITACTAAFLTIATSYAINQYRHNYQQGRIISLPNYLATYPARRRMRTVIRTMLPLWKSKYDIPSTAATSPIRFVPTDVIVFAPPKCGTTWVTHMCHQIRARGAPVTFEDQDDAVPWIERLGTPYLEGSCFNNRPDAVHAALPRVFKSHLEWESRPEGSYKQIWVFRNFVDMMVSVANFLPSLWGIEPGLSEAEMCSFLLENGDVEEAMRSLARAWEHQMDAGMLLLFYENIVEDHRGTAKRLAEFMEVSLSAAELDRIVGQTTKEGMLQHHGAFACRTQAKNAHRARGMVLDDSKLVGKVRPGSSKRRSDSFHDKGVKGGRNSDVLSAVQRAWECFVAKETGVSSYENMRHGRE